MSKGKKSEPLMMDVVIVEKESHQRVKEEIKIKGISSEPHPKDRESGTGRGKEMRKNGQGKHNWGTYLDDFKDYGINEIDERDICQQDSQHISSKFRLAAAQKEIIRDDYNFPKLS